MKKRILSLLITTFLATTLFSTVAFAESAIGNGADYGKGINNNLFGLDSNDNAVQQGLRKENDIQPQWYLMDKNEFTDSQKTVVELNNQILNALFDSANPTYVNMVKNVQGGEAFMKEIYDKVPATSKPLVGNFDSDKTGQITFHFALISGPSVLDGEVSGYNMFYSFIGGKWQLIKIVSDTDFDKTINTLTHNDHANYKWMPDQNYYKDAKANFKALDIDALRPLIESEYNDDPFIYESTMVKIDDTHYKQMRVSPTQNIAEANKKYILNPFLKSNEIEANKNGVLKSNYINKDIRNATDAELEPIVNGILEGIATGNQQMIYYIKSVGGKTDSSCGQKLINALKEQPIEAAIRYNDLSEQFIGSYNVYFFFKNKLTDFSFVGSQCIKLTIVKNNDFWRVTEIKSEDGTTDSVLTKINPVPPTPDKTPSIPSVNLTTNKGNEAPVVLPILIPMLAALAYLLTRKHVIIYKIEDNDGTETITKLSSKRVKNKADGVEIDVTKEKNLANGSILKVVFLKAIVRRIGDKEISFVSNGEVIKKHTAPLTIKKFDVRL